MINGGRSLALVGEMETEDKLRRDRIAPQELRHRKKLAHEMKSQRFGDYSVDPEDTQGHRGFR